MKSIIQQDKRCFVCGATSKLHLHHCISGYGNRQKSDKYGLTVWLCYAHHVGKLGVHNNAALAERIKKTAQKEFEKTHSRNEFISQFGKNYLGEKYE